LPIKHISSYILKIESGTPFDSQEMIKKMPDDDFTSDMYLYMVELLAEHGFKQYEISNFSKDGFESRHNLKYWQCREYIGFGPAAHSYFNGSRYCFSPDLKSFIKSPPEKIITDDSPGSDEEKIMLGLRLSAGIRPDDFPDRKDVILRHAGPLEKAGLVVLKNGTLSLTTRGFLVSNSIINEITL
ncbi:MAG: coproporphyrinogen III oxidase family protein, partial [Porcipelethomonas sp.]